MPITSVSSDAEALTLTVVGDYPAPVARLWEAYADPRQLERFDGLRHMRMVFNFEETPTGSRFTGVTYFTSIEDMEQLVAMGMIEGMQSTMGQLDALLADLVTTPTS